MSEHMPEEVASAVPGEVVELRIHGVHGTSPASMIGVEQSDVRQVAGDNLTGLYRSRSGKLPYRDVSGDDTTVKHISVEAYSWGALTSGVRGFLGWLQRALWLLLLPFALANLAYWARLELDGSKPSARWGARLTRLGALLLTVFLVLTPCLIGIDLVAWQCYRGGSPGCSTLPGVLDFLARLSPGQRLAVGSGLPLFFIAVLWFVSRVSLMRYEEVRYHEGDLGSSPLVLRHPTLWQGKERTQQMQRAHLAIALAVVVAFSGVHVVRYHGGPEGFVWATLVLSAIATVTLVLWTLTIHPHDVEYRGVAGRLVELRRSLFSSDTMRRQVRERLPGAVLGVMILVTIGHLIALWLLPTDPAHGFLLQQQVDFFGHNVWFLGTFVALTAVHVSVFTHERMSRWEALAAAALVVLLGVGALLLSLGRFPESWRMGWVLLGVALLFFVALAIRHQSLAGRFAREAWKGAGASVLLASAAWVGLLFTTGAVTATANYLNGGDHGVEDLVSQLADDTGSLAPEAVSRPKTGTTFVATGDVVLRDAVVTYRGGSPRGVPLLRSGTVISQRLYDAKEKQVVDLRHVALQKGELGVHAARLVIDADSVRLEGSCVRLSNTTPCTAESTRFLAGGKLQLKKAILQIRSPDGVRLEPTDRPAVPLVVPQVLIWAPLAQTLWLLLTILWAGAAFGWVFLRTRGAVADQVLADGIPSRDREACRKARGRAVFAHRAERVVDVLGAYTSVLIVVLIVASCQGKAPWVAAAWLRPFATVGMYVAVGLGLALVMLFSRVRSSENARRAVGVLWDLTTFWPRAAHPLAPPCYAERVVPEVLTRIDWVLHFTDDEGKQHRGDNMLILSAHSQGSVIACAALSRMEDAELARTKVITYGSQIRALYGRIFPAVFGPDQMGNIATSGPAELGNPFPDTPVTGPGSAEPYVDPDLAGESSATMPLMNRVLCRGGDWVNLFRRSDPLGFRIFSDLDGHRDRYVPEVPDVIVGDAGPQVNTHSGYQHTKAYREAVAAWDGEKVQEDPVSTANVPALPTA